MSTTRILDCTLRDGGYINNWKFGIRTIKSIISNLEDAGVDIIECGFIRKEEHSADSSVFSSMEQVADVIAPKKANINYAIMIEQHNHVDELIPENDGNGADIIRITFRRKEWEEAKVAIKGLICKGYKVCVQPVGTATYDDESLLKLIKDVNQIKPYAFYLVDTLGMMYRHEMRRFFYLIDNNLSKDIYLGFHSHNNLQMSFANAQEMMRLAKQRRIIVDTSCYGMGRGAGNLATELFADYVNNTIEYRYALTPILNIVDKYLMPIYAEQRWGYDLPYFLAATVKCHPNYAAYLMKKDTIGIEKIERILSLIPVEERNEYNSVLIEQLYLNFQNCDVNDETAYSKLRNMIVGKEVVVLGSGSSIIKYAAVICETSKDKFVISINYISDIYKTDALFISNDKRLNFIEWDEDKCVLVTSNLSHEVKNALIFNYSALLGEGEESDNSGAMLIRILQKAGAKKIYLAGFDGFDVNASENYAVESFKKTIDNDTALRKNLCISKQLKLALSGVDYEFITPTRYEV